MTNNSEGDWGQRLEIGRRNIEGETDGKTCLVFPAYFLPGIEIVMDYCNLYKAQLTMVKAKAI